MYKVKIIVPEKIRSERLLGEITALEKRLNKVNNFIVSISQGPAENHDVTIERQLTSHTVAGVIIEGPDPERLKALLDLFSSACKPYEVLTEVFKEPA